MGQKQDLNSIKIDPLRFLEMFCIPSRHRLLLACLPACLSPVTWHCMLPLPACMHAD
jgi:hypothetical protein